MIDAARFYAGDVNVILDDPRWDTDPVSLYDELSRRFGPWSAAELWQKACRTFDSRNTEEET